MFACENIIHPEVPGDIESVADRSGFQACLEESLDGLAKLSVVNEAMADRMFEDMMESTG